MHVTLNSSFYSIFWPQENTFIKKSLVLLAGLVLLAASSQLSIPFLPVPLTFQSTTVILIGMAGGARYGLYVISAYLFAGMCGLPVFADFSAGLVTLFGPTGGYLVGFIPAVFLSGYLAEKGVGRSVLGSLLAAGLGVSIIFLFGLAWLATFVGWSQALSLGLMPFLLSEGIKIAIVACMIPRCWKKR